MSQGSVVAGCAGTHYEGICGGGAFAKPTTKGSVVARCAKIHYRKFVVTGCAGNALRRNQFCLCVRDTHYQGIRRVWVCGTHY